MSRLAETAQDAAAIGHGRFERRRSHPSLGDQIARLWETNINPSRSMRQDQRVKMESFAEWSALAIARHVAGKPDKDVTDAPDGGIELFRALPQLVRGMEARMALHGVDRDRRWRDRGSVKANHDAYAHSVRDTVEQFCAIGWMSGKRERRKTNKAGEGTYYCWTAAGVAALKAALPSLPPAGVAQSVRAAESTARRTPRRRGAHDGSQPASGGAGRTQLSLFFRPQVPHPSWEERFANPAAVAVVGREVSAEPTANGGASARVASKAAGGYQRWLSHAARQRLLVKATLRASMLAAGNSRIEEIGARLSREPWIGDTTRDPTAVARMLFKLALPDVEPRISRELQTTLEAGARRLDHYSGRGAWVQYAGEVLGEWAAGKPGYWISEPPRSLGALALELKREANMRRLWALERRRQRLRPLEDYRRRAAVKRWRARRRRGEAPWRFRGPGA